MPSATVKVSSGSGTGKSNRSERVPSLSSSSSSSASTSTTSGRTTDQIPIQIKSCYLPYQYRGEFHFRPGGSSNPPGTLGTTTSCTADSVPNRNNLTRCHPVLRLGLGTPVNNLKTSHIVSSKKEVRINVPMRKIVPAYYTLAKTAKVPKQQKEKDCTGGGGLTSKMQRLKIYEDPILEQGSGDSSKEKCVASVYDAAFKNIDRKANLLAQGHPVTFTCRGDVFTVQKDLKTGKDTLVWNKLVGNREMKDLSSSIIKDRSKAGSSDSRVGEVAPRVGGTGGGSDGENTMKAVTDLCRHFRGLLGWQMSLHVKWKYLEDRVKLWPNQLTPLSLTEIAEILKVSEEDVRDFRLFPDLKEIFYTLRSNLCHVNYPNIAKMFALSELKSGNRIAAAKYAAESTGMFLQSEIVDKHLNYIRRGQELGTESPRGDNEDFKNALFLKQVKDTLNFTKGFFEDKGDKAFIKAISNFDPEWNIVQLTTANDSLNQFSNDYIRKRQVPQIILSAYCNIPGQKMKSVYSAFCPPPRVEPGSRMRYGLLEEFQQVLDRNLAISDETTVISRKKYWEERGRHNESLEGILLSMEEWINPWAFLLPGRIKDEVIQKKIHREILSHPVLARASDSQKLLISRLSENLFALIPHQMDLVLDTFVALILELEEEQVSDLAQKMSRISSEIPSDAPRHPTILVIDQEIDILPWDWLPCLRSTDVTRMPSLNVISSSKAIACALKTTYPVVVDATKCTFILNPDGTLPNVQQRMESYLKERTEWKPIVARPPTAPEMQSALESQDILLYCGHGAGSHYYPEYAVQKLVCRAVPLLMGCSSAQSHYTGPRLYSNSVVNTYFIAGCSSVVGFLWEVTDTECDRLTVDLLERWVPFPSAKPPTMPFFDKDLVRDKEDNLPTAVRKSRSAATQFLTKCAVVCYGLPISTVPT